MSTNGFRYPKRVGGLRDAIRDQGEVDGILITDPYNRRYLSGFIGSAGYLFITDTDAVLVTDFRYTEQAGEQAKGFQITQMQGKLDTWFPPAGQRTWHRKTRI